MKPARFIASVIAVIAFALGAQAPAARAMILVATPAVHTAAGHAHHALRHRAHHAPRAQFSRRAPGVPAPAPARRALPRPERGAALPHATRLHRPTGGERGGYAMLAPTTGALLALSVARLDTHQNEIASDVVGEVTSGRGPPRAGPSQRHAPAFTAGPPSSLRSAVLRSASHSRACAVTDPGAFVCPGRRCVRPGRSAESVFGSSLVRRPEGTTARIPLPSIGEVL